MITEVLEYPEVERYLNERGLLEKYKKSCAKLLRGEWMTVGLKKRKPRKDSIWSFRIDKKYRALGVFRKNIFVVFEIDDHQQVSIVQDNMEKLIIHTDGGARGNPGPAGIGVHIADEHGKTLKEAALFLGVQTNNYAEYMAVIEALAAAKKLVPKEKRSRTHIDMRMDSELVARQLNGKYQIKEPSLFPLFIKVWNIRVADFPNISFTHVPREKNKDADRLSNEAMDAGAKSKLF
ncbi:MAG: reverse transcriptase-like protein [Candidatus Vogelbacteria bacterium]|nr:reverse transcriptase-like protein [Candidatus Vogelbacteria bacterium]